MVLDSVARIVKVQLPAYLKQLPVPDSITGFARLTGNPTASRPILARRPVGGEAVESPARGGAGRQAVARDPRPVCACAARRGGGLRKGASQRRPCRLKLKKGAELGVASLVPRLTAAYKVLAVCASGRSTASTQCMRDAFINGITRDLHSRQHLEA